MLNTFYTLSHFILTNNCEAAHSVNVLKLKATCPKNIKPEDCQ